MNEQKKHWLSWLGKKEALALGLIALFTSMHYLTDMHHMAFHNVYRRLYYLPILILSFSQALKGGLSAATLVTIAYIPHAFFSDHRDPSPDIDKALEIVLYYIMGGLTGWLVARQRLVQLDLEHALLEKNAMERQLVRAGRLSALGELTEGLAHEIRNPLAAILGSAEALAVDYPPKHRKHRLAVLLLKEIQRLRQVVDDFLHFARPSETRKNPIDLHTLVQEVHDLTTNEAQRLHVDVNIKLHTKEAIIKGDEGQISQVILNLTLNAFQALERKNTNKNNQIDFITDIKTLADRSYRRLGIRDNGPGIPPEEIERVFNPYFTTRAEGTGLGLSISNRIMETHNGYIDIDSTPGQTTVWLLFPTETP